MRVFAYNCKRFSPKLRSDSKTKIFPFDTPAEIRSLLCTFFSRSLPVEVCDRELRGRKRMEEEVLHCGGHRARNKVCTRFSPAISRYRKRAID